ncbi:hypothetical protein [Lysinibacillus sp. NPDC047702]|uniref:hypothetical protein n=1 Tax=unclassified Lysinibacillus TaxID=2636778 RepID=UPI003D05A70C
MTYKGRQISKKTLTPSLEQEINAIKTKADNSWQKDIYNNARIINLGTKKATRTFTVNQADWKNTGNVEQLGIVIPFRGAFSGSIKVTYSVMWGETGSWGSTSVAYNIGSFPPQGTKLNEFTILTASSTMMKDFHIVQPFIDTATGDIAILVFRAPNANNPLEITVELDGTYSSATYNSNLFNALKDGHINTTDLRSTTAGGYPWTPQTVTTLMANTYNGNSLITNVGANRAARIFPQINWKTPHGQTELWESVLYLDDSLWGIIELDIAGYSNAHGGAKMIVEWGFVSSPSSTESQEFKNTLKVISASPNFTENFYVQTQHRPDSKALLIQIFKRNVSDSLSLFATLTTTNSSRAAYEFLNKFTNGSYFPSVTVPAHRQKDLDRRISENFTLFGDFKAKLAPAITEKGVPTNADATADQMVANVRAIPTGGQVYDSNIASGGTVASFAYANGVGNQNSPYIQIVFIFKPKLIHLWTTSGALVSTIVNQYSDGLAEYTAKLASYNGGITGGVTTVNLKSTYYQSGNNWNFTIPVNSVNTTYRILAL